MKRSISLVVCALFMVVLMSGVALSSGKQAAEQGAELNITGTINNANQLIDADGQIFDIADTEEGKQLLTHVDQKVEVKGTVMESEGKKVLTILHYEIIQE